MKKTSILLVAICIVLNAGAYDFKVGRFYYDIISSDKPVSVAVTFNTDATYSGVVNIPPSVTYQGKTYPVKYIGSSAFKDCFEITAVTIPNSITEIWKFAFAGCTGLTKIIIPNSVKDIGSDVFSECSDLTTITLPNAITDIGDNSFYNCTSLAKIVIPNSVTSIGKFAFQNCSTLATINIPSSVTTIEEKAFDRCQTITAITIPKSVTKIGAGAFSGCHGLTTVTIPGSVRSIAEAPFELCRSLKTIIVESNPNFSAQDGVLFNKSGTSLIQYPQGKPGTSYEIPASVRYIERNAFSFCNLTSITIPNSVEGIADFAFAGCTDLRNIKLARAIPPRTNFYSFHLVKNSCTLEVPAGTKAAYANSDWKKFSVIKEY
jgi:hypothetical protein